MHLGNRVNPTLSTQSVLASSYSLIVILFGIKVYHERLTRDQVIGIIMFMVGLILLALIKIEAA